MENQIHSTSSNQKSPLFRIPGEVRNQIIEICILAALTKKLGTEKAISTTSKLNLSGVTVSIWPKWSGPGCLRFNGIRRLPLIFVNKQLHQEVLSYVESMVKEVSIGGYIVQFPNEDPRTRWSLVYPLLEHRPRLKFVQSVKISLPREGDERCKRHWAVLGLQAPKTTNIRKSWLVLPRLEKELTAFPPIQKLVVVVVVTTEESEPPNFDILLPLYRRFQDRITIEIVAPGFPGDPRSQMVPWVEKWKNAWETCRKGSG